MQTTTTEPEKRGPGRPPKERRRRRKGEGPFGERMHLSVPESMLDRDRFQYRWVNDLDARLLLMTKEDDYDLVTKNGEDVDSVDLGNVVSRIAGASKDGTPMRTYLCRKPLTYWDADQKAKQENLDAQVALLRQGKDRNGADQGDYVPTAGISISR